jgi:hypothetical protein
MALWKSVKALMCAGCRFQGGQPIDLMKGAWMDARTPSCSRARWETHKPAAMTSYLRRRRRRHPLAVTLVGKP